MGKIPDETLNNIHKVISSHNLGTEHSVFNNFDELGYIIFPRFYYEDFDTKKQHKVIRELDILATKRIENESPQKQVITLTFLGDVKLREKYEKRLVFGLGMGKSLLQVGTEFLKWFRINKSLSEVFSSDLIQKVSSNVLFHRFNGFKPFCFELEFFNVDGKQGNGKLKEDEIRRYCHQIYSAFYTRKRDRDALLVPSIDEGVERIEEYEITLPIIIFGNEIDFYFTQPKEFITSKTFKNVKGLIYMFQPTSRKGSFQGFLFPIILTSLNNVREIVNEIEFTIQSLYPHMLR